jgi:hypothetical protein
MPTKSNFQAVMRYLGVAPAHAGVGQSAQFEALSWPDARPCDAAANDRPAIAFAGEGWDKLRVRKRKALRMIASYRQAIERNPSLRTLLEDDIAHEKRIHDLIETYLPEPDPFAPARRMSASFG